jgi:hypothetical protein
MTRLIGRILAAIFGFTSGVVRDARTFHPDGRTFVATVHAAASDPALTGAASMLEGRALMRIGMGVLKTTAPSWLRNNFPDAPSMSVRFSASPDADAISLRGPGADELVILFTAGGDRLWKLVLNLATGGRCFGLNKFDYFANRYFADVPYRLPDGRVDAWLRLVADPDDTASRGDRPNDAAARERDLGEAAARGASMMVEAQRKGDGGAPFLPVVRVRFDMETTIDQEALHFQPTTGRGFRPHGALTTLRDIVYPASAHARPPNRGTRAVRDRAGFFARLWHRLSGARETDNT